jgi:hypothetical protein
VAHGAHNGVGVAIACKRSPVSWAHTYLGVRAGVQLELPKLVAVEALGLRGILPQHSDDKYINSQGEREIGVFLGPTDPEALTGDATTHTGDAIALTGDPIALTGDAKALMGHAITLTGDAITLTGDAITLTGHAITLTNGRRHYPHGRRCR